jgi:hypothetical protein
MSDLINKIRHAQMIAGENAVIESLRARGLLDPATPLTQIFVDKATGPDADPRGDIPVGISRELQDITKPNNLTIEVQQRHNGKVIYIHIDGRTVFRACQVTDFQVILPEHEEGCKHRDCDCGAEK